MSSQRSTTPSRGWFPPVTFQMRLRSLQSIIFIASSKPRKGHSSGFFYVSLQERPSSQPFWTSSKLKWNTEKDETRLIWSDLDFSNCNIHPALRSVVVIINFQPENKDLLPIVDTRWGIYFSGLLCLGSHPPPHGRLPPDAIILYMNSTYFSSANHIKENISMTFMPRFLHIGKSEAAQAVGSYDTHLLGRLQFILRALKKQEDDNKLHKSNLRQKGVIDLSEADQLPQTKRDTRKSVSVFSRLTKSPTTRLREAELRAQIEMSRVRVELLSLEKERLELANCDMRSRRMTITAQIEEKSSFLMRCFHGLAKEKSNFRCWMQDFEQDCKAHSAWTAALRRQRLSLINSLSFIYPVDNLEHPQPTLRWVALPAASELRDMTKKEELVSVVIGWLADLLTVISRIIDAPLRYPINLQGSTSTIIDHLKMVSAGLENESREFPLFIGKGNNDWNRFEYGIYLLNKNLSQLRWQCSLVTTDLRPILKNLFELYALGDSITPLSEAEIDLLPKLKTLTSPPKSSEHQIVIKSGRAHIQGANRGPSPTKSFQSSPSDFGELLRRNSRSDFSESPRRNSRPDLNELQRQISRRDERISRLNSQSESLGVEEEEIMDSHEEDHSSSSENESYLEVLEKQSSSNESPPKGIQKLSPSSSPMSPNGSASIEGKEQFVFWGDVTSRTQALSNPSSFQRPRTNNH